MSEYIRNGRLIDSVTVSVPSRAAIAGNPSDLAKDMGIGAVISMPVRDFVGTVSIYPSETFRIVGPETTAPTLLGAIRDITGQGFSNGDHLIRATLATVGEMVQSIGLSLDILDVPMTVAWGTNIPRQRGMSGSSSLVIAPLKGFLKIFGLENHEAFRPELLAEWALSIEHKLGITAGLQDRVLQCYADKADAVFMDFSREAFARHGNQHGDYMPIKIKGNLPKMALLLSSQPSHSGAAHEPIKQKIHAGERKVLKDMEELALLAHEAQSAFVSEDWPILGQIMDRNAMKRVEIYGKEALGKINIAMLEACHEAGCPANFTGSGGAIVALTPDERSLERLRELMSKRHEDQFEVCPLN